MIPSISHKTSSEAVVKDCLPLSDIFLLPILSVIFFAPGILEERASTILREAIVFSFAFAIGSS